MVAMFMHVLVHDVKNHVIQWKFVQPGETVLRHFNLVQLDVLRLYDELIRKPVPVINNSTDQHWKCFVVGIVYVRIAFRYYNLCDAGYAEGFLTPYRGQRYHLQEWRGDGNPPTTAKEYFLRVMERAFSVLKSR
ncbi:retrotransposon protein [Cucumis melo var. makuwa]|uniref:Retrotransposon protein n=1 Tax=Cucumis melo var. makuwa TaxID=1194695 RepID=A0A5A7TTQ2_CUCMM|nr:retrotransposon protein [Cucumis melo var. makuwa]TYJ97712.1 retrotransposon protein [Cucumis melo var. makuwa]